MKKKFYKIVAVASVVSLVGCNLISNDDKSEVSGVDDLPACSAKKGISGTNNIGVKMYVEKEDTYYMCTESGWKISNSSEVFVAGDNLVAENVTLTGSVNGLGPIDIGSPIEIRELAYDAEKESFMYTGFMVTDSSTNNNGDYVSPKINFYSPYIEVGAKGYYKDAMTGKTIADPMELKAFANISQNSIVNVSIYSTLVASRIKKLVNSDYNFDAAVLQANKEIIQNFGFKTSDDLDAIALAIAVVLRGHPDSTKTSLSDVINNISKDFASDGVIEDMASMVKFADFAFNLEYLKYRDEDTDEPLLKLVDIRNNLENWSNDTVPAFEAILTKFWNHIYGLDKCSASKKNAVLQNSAAKSDSADTYFTCDMSGVNGTWRLSTEFERDTVGLGNDEDGALSKGNDILDTTYIFDTTGTGVGQATRWKYADSITIEIGKGCNDTEDMLESFEITKDKDKNNNFYYCNNRRWNITDTSTYVIGYLCKDTLVNSVEKYGKGSDEKYFRCQKQTYDGIDFFMWVATTEAMYRALDAKVECDTVDLVEMGKKDYLVCSDYEKYDFRQPTELELEVLKPCTKYTVGSVGEGDGKYYRCKEISDAYISWTPITKEVYLALDAKIACDSSKILEVKDGSESIKLVCSDTQAPNYRKATADEIMLDAPCSAYSIGSVVKNSGKSYTCGCEIGTSIVTEYTDDFSDLTKCNEYTYPVSWINS